jgi:prevent-host-death family protein
MKVSKSELKPKLFEYLKRVSETGKELIITDHGKPVLKIVSIAESEGNPLASLRGSLLWYNDPFEPVDVVWEAAESSGEFDDDSNDKPKNKHRK